MRLDHAAIWTKNLELLRDFYCRYFNGIAGEMYHNKTTGLRTYFIQFEGQARLELMQREDIPENRNDRLDAQHEGLIHLAFFLANEQEVEAKANELKAAGIPILRGPRVTGDGYFEFETIDPDKNRLEVGCRAMS